MTNQVTVSLAANAFDKYVVTGQALVVHAASHAFEISFDGENYVDVNEGTKLPMTEGFEEFYVRNPSGVDVLSATIYYGSIEIQSTANSVTILSGSVDATIENWPVAPIEGTFVPEINDGLTPLADLALTGAAQVASAAAITKRETHIKNPSTNAGSIRYGGATVAAAKGLELEVGESVILHGDYAVHVIGTVADTISITEVHKA